MTSLMAGLGLGSICLFTMAFVAFKPRTIAETNIQIYEPLTVAAFNAQNLGNTKFRKPDVLDIIIKIILRYDIICLQEVVTQDQQLQEELLSKVNEQSERPYLMKASERLGRDTTAKEQYLYFYREDRLRVLSEEVYPDAEEQFVRPPYILYMESSTTKNVRSFVAFCVHTKPDAAAQEISALASVFDYTKSTYQTEDTIIMGDFNAACGSVRVNDWPSIDLYTRSDFMWLFNESVDTSSYTSGCANDRIVLAGENMKNDFIRNSARAFDFQEPHSLTTEQTRAVSDHYPVEMALKGMVSEEIIENVEADICVSVSDKRDTDPQILINYQNDLNDFEVLVYNDADGNNVRVDATAKTTGVDGILLLFDEMNRISSGLLSDETAQTLKHKVKFGSLDDPGAHTDIASPTFSLKVECFVETSRCSIQVCKRTYYN